MTSRKTTLARNLRKNQTDAERILWSKLRAKQLDGIKFRRQQPIGCYIVDFVCRKRHLIIELDGGQHATDVIHDKIRGSYLERQGFTILRFWNNDVLKNIDGVLEVIRRNVLNNCSTNENGMSEDPPLTPPKGRGIE